LKECLLSGCIGVGVYETVTTYGSTATLEGFGKNLVRWCCAVEGNAQSTAPLLGALPIWGRSVTPIMEITMNLVLLIGNLGETPVVRATNNGTSVTTFSVATTERWKDGQGQKQEKTTWHKVQAWGTNADNCATYLKKGSRIQVTGRNDQQPWTDQNGVKRNPTIVVMERMEMLGDPGHTRGATNVPAPPPVAVPAPPAPATGPSYEQLIGNGWTPEQIASQPEYAHLKPAAQQSVGQDDPSQFGM